MSPVFKNLLAQACSTHQDVSPKQSNWNSPAKSVAGYVPQLKQLNNSSARARSQALHQYFDPRGVGPGSLQAHSLLADIETHSALGPTVTPTLSEPKNIELIGSTPSDTPFGALSYLERDFTGFLESISNLAKTTNIDSPGLTTLQQAFVQHPLTQQGPADAHEKLATFARKQTRLLNESTKHPHRLALQNSVLTLGVIQEQLCLHNTLAQIIEAIGPLSSRKLQTCRAAFAELAQNLQANEFFLDSEATSASVNQQLHEFVMQQSSHVIATQSCLTKLEAMNLSFSDLLVSLAKVHVSPKKPTEPLVELMGNLSQLNLDQVALKSLRSLTKLRDHDPLRDWGPFKAHHHTENIGNRHQTLVYQRPPGKLLIVGIGQHAQNNQTYRITFANSNLKPVTVKPF